ncbi:MAG: ribosomal protein S18-alanine N-acetyltransferase [Devosia sp.]
MNFWLNPATLHVEPARGSDAETIARLHAEGFYRGWTREEFAAYITGEGTPVYVACDAKRKIAGFAMLRHLGEDVELITIAVDRKWRGKGVGLMLMRVLFDAVRMSPAKRMLLEVAADNTAALKLYGKLGFLKVGEREGYYPRPDGTPATAIVMARDLG